MSVELGKSNPNNNNILSKPVSSNDNSFHIKSPFDSFHNQPKPIIKGEDKLSRPKSRDFARTLKPGAG